MYMYFNEYYYNDTIITFQPNKARRVVRTVEFVTTVDEATRIDEVGNHAPPMTDDASERPKLRIGDKVSK